MPQQSRFSRSANVRRVRSGPTQAPLGRVSQREGAVVNPIHLLDTCLIQPGTSRKCSGCATREACPRCAVPGAVSVRTPSATDRNAALFDTVGQDGIGVIGGLVAEIHQQFRGDCPRRDHGVEEGWISSGVCRASALKSRSLCNSCRPLFIATDAIRQSMSLRTVSPRRRHVR